MTTRSDGGQPLFQPSMTCRQTMAASCRCLAWSCSLTAWRERPRAAVNKQAPRSRPARPSVRKKKPLASGDTDAPGLRRHDDRTRIGPIGRSNDHSHRMLRTTIDSKVYISFRYLQARRIGPFFDPDVAFLDIGVAVKAAVKPVPRQRAALRPKRAGGRSLTRM